MKRGEEDVHMAEYSPVHLSAILPIVMQLQTTVTTIRAEAMANEAKVKAEVTELKAEVTELKAEVTALKRHEAKQKAEVTALESTMVTMVKYEY